MKTYSKCGTPLENQKFCPECGEKVAQSDPSERANRYIPITQQYVDTTSGRTGAIVRMVLSAIAFVISILGFFHSLFTIDRITFANTLVHTFQDAGAVCMLIVILWSTIKWGIFIAPKSKDWATNFWERWIPLTFIGIAIKVMVYLWILLTPILTIPGMLIGGLAGILLKVFQAETSNLILWILYFFVCFVLMLFMLRLDWNKIRGKKAPAVTVRFALGTLIAMLAMCVLLCGLSAVANAIPKPGSNGCRHENIEWVILEEATCEAEGLQVEQCTACKTQARKVILKPTGHTEAVVPAVAPGEKSCGWSEGISCSVCQKVLKQPTVVAPLCQTSQGMTCLQNMTDGSYSITDMGTCQDTAVIIPVMINGHLVTKLATGSLYGDIVSVELLDNITHISGHTDDQHSPFESLELLEQIIVSPENKVFFSKDGILYSKETGNILFIPMNLRGEVVISDTVTDMQHHSFRTQSQVTAITLPSGLTQISTMQFLGCSNLTRLDIPAGLKLLDTQALNGCTSLTDIFYGGTKAQWEAITKEDRWYKGTGDFVIHCTDGDIPKP